MQTVVETPLYLADAERLFSALERAAIMDRLAADPSCGVLIPGGGGIRFALVLERAERVAEPELSISSAVKTCRYSFSLHLPRMKKPTFPRRNVMHLASWSVT